MKLRNQKAMLKDWNTVALYLLNSKNRCIIDYVCEVTDLMEYSMNRGFSFESVIDENSILADRCLKGNEFYIAASIIIYFWCYGDDYKIWYNKNAKRKVTTLNHIFCIEELKDEMSSL